MNRTLTAALALPLLMLAQTADADRDRDHLRRHHDRDHGRHGDYARVVDSQPIFENVTYSSPQRVCWEETQYERRSPSATGTILGGIAGGVVGNRFGEGKGKDAMTVAGALLGASIAHEATRGGDAERVTTQRCRVTHDEYEEQRVIGYRVTYRYQGRNYTTRMPYEPGEWIKLRVDVSPAY